MIKTMVIPLAPMSAPRQTRSDAWKPRPVVKKYRQWRDSFLRYADSQGLKEIDLKAILRIDVLGFYPIPKSWAKKKKLALAGKLMRNRSDADNLTKAVGDTIYRDSIAKDSVVGIMAGEQRWEDALGSRMMVRIFTEEEEENISLFDYEPVTGGNNLARLINRTTKTQK